jgi:hypothetical protein
MSPTTTPDMYPDAWVISASYSAGWGPVFNSWSIDIVITDDEIGIFHVEGIGPGLGTLQQPSSIRQEQMDTSFMLIPNIGSTLYVAPVWGDSLNQSVQNYQGPALAEGGSLLFKSGEWFESVHPQTGVPDGNIMGGGIGLGPGLLPAEAHRVFMDATHWHTFLYRP